MQESAHELAQTYDCKTPGCTGTANSNTGRHAYCLPCRVNRGTALPDGTPVEAVSKALSRRRRSKQVGRFEEKALTLVEAGRGLDLAVARYQVARPGLEMAVAAWREVVGDLQALELGADSKNGSAPD